MEEVEFNDEIIDQEDDSVIDAGTNIIKQKLDFEKAKKHLAAKKKLVSKLLIIVPIALVCLLLTLYIASDKAKVKSIKIINNNFLSDEYIKELTGINEDSKFLLLFPSFKTTSAKKSVLVDDISINRGANHSVVIDVKENGIVGYRYDDKMELVLSDGTLIEFDNKYIKNLAVLPMFIGVGDQKASTVAKEMAKLNVDVLTRISEVRNFALSYDDDMVKFIMEDGYVIYTPIEGVELLKGYLDVIVTTNSKFACMYLDPINNVINVRDCDDIEGMNMIEDEPIEEQTQQEEGEQS